MKRTLSHFALGAVAAAALFAVACGGGGGIGGGGGSSLTGADFNKDPVTFARAYYFTGFRVFTDDTKAEDMLKLFEPSCRDKVAIADVSKGLEKNRDEFPKLKGAKLEDIDFQGKATVNKTSDGATVTIPSGKDSRVKVDGKYQNAFEYFKGVGLIGSDSEGGKTSDIALVLRDGRYYDADCSNLTDIADSGKRASATPTPVRITPTVTTGNRTPTPSATSRTGVSSNLSSADVEAFAKTYFIMLIGAFTGQTKAADVLNFYTSECRAKVTTANVTAGLNKLATQQPKMKGDKIEDLDFAGKTKVTPTSNGFTIEVPGSRDSRIKVNGQFVNLHTYAQNAGLESASETGAETSKQSFVVQGGKLYDADCGFVEDVASTR